MYYGINNFISLYDKACEKFKIKSVRISNTIHSLTSSKADLEEEVYFNFTECPAVMKQEMFTAKYVDAKDVQNLKKLIHCRGIAKAFVGKEVFQDMQTKMQAEMQKLGVNTPFGGASAGFGGAPAPAFGQPQMGGQQMGAQQTMLGQTQAPGQTYVYGPNGELIPKEDAQQ